MKGTVVKSHSESVLNFNVDTPWNSPPENLVLGKNEVHVWRAALNVPAAQRLSLQQTLTADELARAVRFHFEKDREHFIVARGLLRNILGRYLDAAPGQLRFSYSLHGKPSLAPQSTHDDLCFNLAHASGLALYAVTRARDIGVDIERISPHLADEQVAERFFSPQEVAELRNFSGNVLPQAFFNCWTRKEAYIKARGEGLSLPLDQFAVSLAPGEPAALLSCRGDGQEARSWSLEALDPAEGYVAAVAVEGHGWLLKCWRWQI